MSLLVMFIANFFGKIYLYANLFILTISAFLSMSGNS